MTQVLYRKYRSKDFSEIFGQEGIKQILRQSVLDNVVAHAYLFTGPRGTGKTSMARILAKALNCSDLKNGNPCNKCANCLAINNANFLDLIEIDAASNRGIDEIRDLKEKVGFLPAEGSKKVYIIDEVHMLTTEAFNALLKTLEEPPKNVVFILATTEAHKLPATIISRTQRFDFKLAGREQLQAKLEYILKSEKIKVESDALDLIVEAGQGSFRDAETILEKVLSALSRLGGTSYTKDGVISTSDVSEILGLADSKIITGLFDALASSDTAKAFELLATATEGGIDFARLIKQLLLKARGELIKNIQTGSTKYQTKFLYVLIRELNDSSEKLKTSLVPSLVLEMAILSIVDLSSTESGSVGKTKAVDQSKTSKITFSQKSISSKTSKTEQPSTKKKQSKQPEKISKTVVTESKVDMDHSEGSIDSDKIDSRIEELLPAEITEGWDKLLGLAKQTNPHLAAILIKSVVTNIQDGFMNIEVPFKFHQKRLESARSQKLIGELTEKIFGTALSLKVMVNELLVKQGNQGSEEIKFSNTTLVEEVFGDSF